MAEIKINSQWHYGDPPRVGCTGTLSASYSGLTVYASVSIDQSLKPYSTITLWGFGGDTLHLFIDGHEVGSCTIGGSNGPIGSGTASGSKEVSAGNISIEAKIQCADTKCGVGAGGGPDSWASLGSFTLEVPEPYTAPSYSLNSVTKIGRVNVTDYSINYTIDGGTNNLNWVHLDILDASGNYTGTYYDLGTAKGKNKVKTFKLPNGFSHGAHYKCRIAFSDGHGEDKRTNALDFYTFTEPIINNSVSVITSFPTNANTKNKFILSGQNNATWSSDLEQQITTRYRINRDGNNYTAWQDLGNIIEWERSENQMRQLIPKAYDGKNCVVQFERYSPTPKWESTNKPSINTCLYYRPRMAVETKNVRLFENDGSGTGITQGSFVKNKSTLTGIYVSWSYNTSLPEAGYLSGYRVRLYNHSNKIVNTYYRTTPNITIDINDIPRVYDTYLDITPYFNNDSDNPNNYWYYNGDLKKIPFIKLVTELSKPIIDYPVNGSQWINNDFRICFTLPEDLDFKWIEETYEYENIEIKINKQVFSFKSSLGITNNSIINNTIFSTGTLSHKKSIIVYPNHISNFIKTGSYSIQIRVKKKYGSTQTLMRWSPWSDTTNIDIVEPVYSVNKYDIILALHYNNALDTVDRVRNTYGVVWLNQPNKAIRYSTVIKAQQYSQQTILRLINETKNVVNTYGDFDTNRNYIKFDKDNILPSTFNEQKGELITADKNEGKTTGRNYIKFIYDRCLLLK